LFQNCKYFYFFYSFQNSTLKRKKKHKKHTWKNGISQQQLSQNTTYKNRENKNKSIGTKQKEKTQIIKSQNNPNSDFL
jgi:hypothetical protein